MTHRRARFALFAAVALLAAAAPAAAGGTQVWEFASQAEFATGELDGLSLTQSGRLVAGPTADFAALDAETVWASVLGADGALWLGTGNTGKLFRASAGAVTEVYDAPEVIVSALGADGTGTVYAGTLGTGQIYRVVGDTVTAFAKLPAPYIWALACGRDGTVYAATGPEGGLYSIDRDGNATLLYDSAEQNLLSILIVTAGDPAAETLVFGSSPNGIVYARGTGAGVRTRVIADLPENDVKGLALHGGMLYAAANSVRNRDLKAFLEQAGNAIRSETSGAARTDNRRVVIDAMKGTLYEIGDDRAPQALYSIERNYFTDAVAGDDAVYVSCGTGGLVWAVSEGDTRLLVDRAEDQVQTLEVANGGLRHITTGGQAGFASLRSDLATAGTYLSRVLDAGHTARWGRAYWSGAGAVTLSARAGNTATPDDTWSPWSAAAERAGAQLDAPAGRYFQFRLSWPGGAGAAASVDSVSIYYLRDNQRPVVDSVKVSGTEVKSRAVGGVARTPVREITWRGADGDGDKLTYVVQVIRRGDDPASGWQTISGDNPIAEGKVSWDTVNVPDGMYLARVVAFDTASNAVGRELNAVAESAWFVVDNLAPTIDGLAWTAGNRQVSGTATDGGTITAIEASLNGKDWASVSPDDGILDSGSEPFSFTVSNAAPRRVLVRVTDGAGNSVVGAVNVR